MITRRLNKTTWMVATLACAMVSLAGCRNTHNHQHGSPVPLAMDRNGWDNRNEEIDIKIRRGSQQGNSDRRTPVFGDSHAQDPCPPGMTIGPVHQTPSSTQAPFTTPASPSPYVVPQQGPTITPPKL